MPQVSRYPLDKKTERELVKSLEMVLTRITKKEEMSEFLLALMTKTEKLMFAKRLAIIILLREKVPESRIAKALNVTRVTVARMELFLEARGAGYEIALKMLAEEKQLQEIKELLLKIAGYAVRAAGGRVKTSIL